MIYVHIICIYIIAFYFQLSKDFSGGYEATRGYYNVNEVIKEDFVNFKW